MGKAIIVGAGIGGLTTAVHLLKKGFKVQIIEKESSVGGKINRIGDNNFFFDATATIVMTADIYTEILSSTNIKENLELIKLNPIYNVYYYDGSNYKFYSDLVPMKEELRKIDINLPKQYEKFLFNTLNTYLDIKENFLDKPMVAISELFNGDSLREIVTLDVNKNSYDYLSEFIDNEKFKEYLLFQAMYMGINPYCNSSIYSMIPAITHGYGLYHVKGGLYQYILALERYIKHLGGEIINNTDVKEIIISKGIVQGVRTEQEDFYSDIVVCNADFPYAIEKLFSQEIMEGTYSKNNLSNKKYSYSVFIIYLGLSKKYENLNVHNIFINKNLRESLKDTEEGVIPVKPSFYMYYPTAVDDSFCESGKSVLNIMVRVPNLSHEDIKWDNKKIEEFRKVVMNLVKGIAGLEDIEENIEHEEHLTPIDLEKKYSSYKGAAFGLSHNISQSLYLRPHIKSKKVKGLYFIGSSTHPGNGASIIIGASKVLSDLIAKENI